MNQKLRQTASQLLLCANVKNRTSKSSPHAFCFLAVVVALPSWWLFCFSFSPVVRECLSQRHNVQSVYFSKATSLDILRCQNPKLTSRFNHCFALCFCDVAKGTHLDCAKKEYNNYCHLERFFCFFSCKITGRSIISYNTNRHS